jgi:hypothetical protein
MVKGLEYFRTYFSNHTDQYVLIGGSACSIIMENAGLSFRSTKDFDIVLCVEALNLEFVSAFWKFIKEGSYKHQQKSTGKDIFYRFYSPSNPSFPEMLELFSRAPDKIELDEKSHLTPIPVYDSLVSLSAILLDNNYYDFIHSGKKIIDGVTIINADCLIPLKAKAWIDLSNRKNEGADIDEKDIKKHKNDVLRLYQLLPVNYQPSLPESIRNDLRIFLDSIKNDLTLDPKALGIKNTTRERIIADLCNIYFIEN